MKNILSNISPEQAHCILERLWDKGGDIQKTIQIEAEQILVDVDADDVAQDVFFALDCIDVHELWDRSGANRDGYISSEEMAMDMIEDELSQFCDQIDNYHKLEMYEEEKIYCMGVLKGLYIFEKDSKSEFKDWATDIPGECFTSIIDNWRGQVTKKAHLKEMDNFITEICPNWID